MDHAKLLERLHQYGITGKRHDWSRSYLQERKQQVTVLGSTSRELPVTSGVPQRSLLGPILFLLLVDDLPKTVKTSRIACYADDTTILRESTLSGTVMPCNPTLTTLSAGPNLLGSYLISPSANTSASPTKEHLYHQRNALESCDIEKHLGVWVSRNLISDKQVTAQRAKANKFLGFVCRACRCIQST